MKRMQSGAKKIALALCLVLLLSFSSQAFAQTLNGTVNADKVFFRTKADTQCDYYAKLDKGAKVALLGEAGEFYKVRFDSKTGYIMKNFLSVSGSTQKKLSKLLSSLKILFLLSKLSLITYDGGF